MLNLILSLIIGAVCGCIAGNIMKTNHGLLFNMIIGLVGGVVGGFIFNLLGFAINGMFATCRICATIWCILSGPVEQFKPTASAPRLCNTTTAVFASVP